MHLAIIAQEASQHNATVNAYFFGAWGLPPGEHNTKAA